MKLSLPMALAVSLGALAATTPHASGRTILIRNATLHTITHGTLEHASLLLKDGKIAAIGTDLQAPEGAELVDGTGKHVLPGLIDPHSHTGDYSWPDVPANSDGNEMTDPINPQVRSEDAINPDDLGFPLALAGGVTTVQVLPGSGNLMGGQAVVIKIKPGKPLSEMRFPGAPAGMKMALGENPKGIYGPRGQAPQTRMGNLALMRDAFTRARAYMKKWDSFRAGKGGESAPETDAKWEALAGLMQGKFLLHVHCYRQDEMQHMVDLSHEFGFKIRSFEHSIEAYKVWPMLKQEGIAISTWPDWWGFKVEAWQGIPENAAILSRHGIRVNLHTDSAAKLQFMNLDAAKAVKAGMDPDEAIKAITLNPAWTLGIEDRVGSLDVGKDADVGIWNGPPLSVFSRCVMTIVDGEVLYRRAQ